MYLLDTNTVSELRRMRPPVRQWLEAQASQDLFISVISLGEIEKGISRAATGDRAFSARLQRWLGETRDLFAANTLPVTAEIALAWGRIAAGRTRDTADALIAATALVHGLTLVTRNIRDFADLPLRVLDPWAS
jgi:predicted nucleic acid-binding protein